MRFDGVTLIMACRNMKRADAARNQLLQWFDAELGRIQRTQEDEEYVRLFREGCNVQIAELDLANFSSMLKFAVAMNRMYVASKILPQSGHDLLLVSGSLTSHTLCSMLGS